MAKDYYKILGVEKGASQDEIKKAFRSRAHQYHPDKSGGDEAKFKEANEAYQVLGNAEKRAQYDQYGQTFQGAGSNGGGGFNGFNGQGFGGFDFSGFQGANGEQFDFGNLDDILGSFFGGGGFHRARRGRDLQVSLKISFTESLFGVEKKIAVPDLRDGADTNKNKEIKVTIPAGIENGQRLKLQGYGETLTDGEPGSLYISIIVEPHKVFRREGMNIVMKLDVKLTDAIRGAKYEIELPDGKKMDIKIPEGMPAGQVLRVKGKGVQAGTFSKGDLYIKTNILIPKSLSKKAKEAIKVLEGEGL